MYYIHFEIHKILDLIPILATLSGGSCMPIRLPSWRNSCGFPAA